MNDHQYRQQSSSAPGRKEDNLQKDNLKDNVQGTSGRAAFTPKPTPLTEAFSNLEKNPPSSPLQMAAAELEKNPLKSTLSDAMQMFKVNYQSPSLVGKKAAEGEARDTQFEGYKQLVSETDRNLQSSTDPEIKALTRSINESIFKLQYHGDYAVRHLNFEQNWIEDARELRKELIKILNTPPISCDALSNLKERAEYFASESGKDIKAMMLAKELLVDLKSIKAQLFSINAWQMANSELSKRLKGKDLLGFDEKMVEARNNLQISLNKIDRNNQLKANLSGFRLGTHLEGIKKHANAIMLWTSGSSSLNIEAQKIIKLLKGYRF